MQGLTIQYVLEIVGTFSFAISGSLAVQGKRQDWFGAAFMAFITAIGGGSLRDVLLGSYPLAWVQDSNILYAILAGFLCSLFFYPQLARVKRTLFLFDTFGIALFTIAGTEKALAHDVDAPIAAIMGMFSAVMGGVIRDTLSNETPIIFMREIYASACLVGGFAYFILQHFGMPREPSFLVAAVLIVIIRILAVKLKLGLPIFMHRNS